jgi:hypothetical protein
MHLHSQHMCTDADRPLWVRVHKGATSLLTEPTGPGFGVRSDL